MDTPSIPAVEVYTRHNSDCPKDDERDWKRCRCPKWLYWRRDGRAVRQSAKTRSWEKAQETARQIEDRFRRALNGDVTALQDAKTVEEAIKLFLEDKREQQSGDALISKLTRLLEVRFTKWCSEQPVLRIRDVSLDHLEAFRKTWPGNALTKTKTQEHLRSFFNFCLNHEWVSRNPAKLLSKIRVDQVPTDCFDDSQFAKILAACDSYRPSAKQLAPRREKVKAMTLLMRWSGLRIGDAIKLERYRLTGNKLLLRTEKTGTPVFCPIPPDVADLLRNTENSNPAFFFWSGTSTAKSAYGDWWRTYDSIFTEANIGKKCHPHMFRDTFAVGLLLSGVPIEQVSMLLGHKSIRVTEKHYSPWVSARQEQLEASVQKSWKAQHRKAEAGTRTKKAGR
jgi:integrase/recombinase XerD